MLYIGFLSRSLGNRAAFCQSGFLQFLRMIHCPTFLWGKLLIDAGKTKVLSSVCFEPSFIPVGFRLCHESEAYRGPI